MHHLMSAAEIGELLKVSRQRVDKIAKTDPTFPQPVAVLRRIRVWETAAVEKWARETGRIK
jgi:predicted DNA-binding transcriptional regulator AlpA